MQFSNNNFLDSVGEFLKANNISPKKSMYSGIKENDKLLEILEEGTVYTYCN